MISTFSATVCRRALRKPNHCALHPAIAVPSSRFTVSRGATRSASSAIAGNDLRDTQKIMLPDGRTMGFSDYGSPDGYPVFYFHGFPSSRLEGSVVDTIARKRQLRFLTLERPGFGISTFQPNRRVVDWARDVSAFAEKLHLDRFAIIGGSGGGPYALACAHELPREMVSAIGLFASGGPYDKSWEGIPMRSRLGHYAAMYWPSGLSAVASGIVGTAKWALRNGPTGRRYEQFLLAVQAKGLDEGSVMLEKTGAELREEAIRTMCEGFAQGPGAFTQEALVLSTHWGFELENVDFDPVQIWHGTEDKNTPIAWVRNMAKRIPHARMVEFDGDSHYSMDKHLERVLTDLVPDSVS